MTDESSASWSRHTTRRVVAVVLIIMALIAAWHGFRAAWHGFRSWQLRHSYLDVLKASRHPSMFRSGRLIDANKERVRKWAEADLMANDPVRDWTWKKERSLVLLLAGFGTEEDLDILLRRAEEGYPVAAGRGLDAGKGPPDRMWLLFGIESACTYVAGNKGRDRALFHRVMRERKITPDIMRTYLAMYGEELETSTPCTAPPNTDTPMNKQPPDDGQPLRKDEDE